MALLCGAGTVHAQGSGYAFRQGPGPSGAFVPFGGQPGMGMPGYGPYYAGYGSYPYYQGYNYPNYYPPMMNTMPGMPMMPGMASMPGMGSVNAATPHGGPGPEGGELPQPFGGPAMFPGMPLPDDGGDDDDPFHRATKECFWAGLQFPLSWLRPMRPAGPLVTTGSPADPHAGALGQPGTVALFGVEDIDAGIYTGIGLQVGVFLDPEDRFSLEMGGTVLFPNHQRFAVASDLTGNPLIARPVFNVVTGQETAFIDALPGVAVGSFVADVRSEMTQAEINARYHMYDAKRLHSDLLFGFRFVRLAESLTIHDQLSPLTANSLTFEGTFINPGDTLTDFDRFKTANHFYGLQIGGRVAWEEEWFFVSAYTKLALGANDEEVDIAGSSTLISPAGVFTAPGGVLALTSNGGQHNRTRLGFIPEVGLNVGLNLTNHLRLSAGYSFTFWNEVVRPSLQIDRAVNPSRIPSDVSFGMVGGPSRPSFSFNDEAFWVHSLVFGIEFHY